LSLRGRHAETLTERRKKGGKQKIYRTYQFPGGDSARRIARGRGENVFEKSIGEEAWRIGGCPNINGKIGRSDGRDAGWFRGFREQERS